MGLKLQPHVARGQILTGILLVFLDLTEHLEFPIMHFIGPLALSPFFT